MDEEEYYESRGHGFFRGFLMVLGSILLVGVLTFGLICIYFYNWAKSDLVLADAIVLSDYQLDQTSVIYYKDSTTGQWSELQNLYGSENRKWTPYSKIPTELVFACVSIEDKRFFEHSGVDWLRTVRACASMFLGRSSFGGSTLTQQLIKNLTGDDDVTVHRKLTEIYRALKLEEDYDKNSIMEMYLNTIYLGEGCYGVESAALHYFGKDVWDLTLAECASLIGITNNPSLYDPYVYPENNMKRQRTILQVMYDQGYIDDEQFEEAKNQELVFKSAGSGEANAYGMYSYFVDEVIRDVIADFMEQYDLTYSEAYTKLTSGGLKIYSTMNAEVQAALEETFREENLPGTKSSQQLQAGMVVIDNTTGDIAGIIGGTGEKSGSLVWNRATQSTLQPGSVMKPIAVYALALEQGLITPATTMDDTPNRFSEKKCWPPNANGVYKGLVNMSYAVANSLNTISIKLVDDLSPLECYRFAYDNMGIANLYYGDFTDEDGDGEDDGDAVLTDVTVWGMGMGSLCYGVTIEEITEAYAAFANRGTYREARTYTSVVDSNGVELLHREQASHTAVSEKTAWYLTYMMEETVTSGTGTSAALANMPVAGKTGTTDDTCDTWFAGYTPYYTAVCWSGYDTPESIVLNDGTAVAPATALWQQTMEMIHANKAYTDFWRPGYIVEASYCQDSGKLCTDACRLDPRGDREVTTLLALEDIPVTACDNHRLVEICSKSGMVATSYCKLQAASGITRIGLLCVQRYFPIEGIAVMDEQYNYLTDADYLAFEASHPVTGYYSCRAKSVVGEAYNLTCPYHVEDVDVKTTDDLIKDIIRDQN